MCAASFADYDAGRQAWDAGKPVEALAQWQAAADAGDRRAMLALGRRYLKGLGVPQDYVLAHMWFNLAASRGENEALKERDSLAENLTPSERAEAQKRAREWRPVRRKTDGPKAASARSACDGSVAGARRSAACSRDPRSAGALDGSRLQPGFGRWQMG